MKAFAPNCLTAGQSASLEKHCERIGPDHPGSTVLQFCLVPEPPQAAPYIGAEP